MRKIVIMAMFLILSAGIVAAQDATPTATPAPSTQVQLSPFVGTDIFDRGAQDFQLQDYQQAVTDYSLFLLLNPTSSESYFRRALSYIQLNDLNSALADLNHALDLPSPSDDLTGRMYALRAVVYSSMNENDAALSDLNAGIKAAPSLPTLYFQRGRLYAQSDKLQEALTDFDKLVELSPDQPDGYAMRAAVNVQLEQYDAALADYNQLATLTPDDPAVFSDRAQIYIQQKQYEPALADLNDAIRLSPGSAGLRLLRGSVNNLLGNQADAAGDYFEWIRAQQTHINSDLVLRPDESQVVQLQTGQVYIMSFRARAGQTITLTATARPDQKTDPLLLLMDSEAHPLIADDDGGGNRDAAIKDYVLPADGVYSVIVGYAGGGSDGPVRVLLQIAQ